MHLPIWLSIIIFVLAFLGTFVLAFFLVHFISTCYYRHLYNKEGIDKSYQHDRDINELRESIDTCINTTWDEIQKLKKMCRDEFARIRREKEHD